MINMKAEFKRLAVFVVLFAIALASNAMASEETQNNYNKLELIATKMGIKVVHFCEDENAYGWYNPNFAAIEICPIAFEHNKVVETLKHELWHALQDWNDGYQTVTSKALWSFSDISAVLKKHHPSKYEFVIDNYEADQWHLEMEAFYMESFETNEFIKHITNQWDAIRAKGK